MPISDFCQPTVVSVVPETTIQEAADIMASRSVGCLVVTDGEDRPVGIFTDRDIVIQSVAKDASTKEPVSSIMSRRVITVLNTAGLAEAVQLMREKRVRRLVVLNSDGRTCGVLSADDLVKLVGSEINAIGELYYAQDGTDSRHRAHEYTRMS